MSRGRRRGLVLAAIGLASVWAMGGLGTTVAAFNASTSNAANGFDTAADWVAPATSSSVIGKTSGGAVGYLKQGATYYVYANVTDSGNPASGTSAVTANVGSITTGQTAVALSSGSFSAFGVSYNYRSASLTANATLTGGTYSYSISTSDAAGNSGTTTFSVVIDNTAPAASDVQTANKTGGVAGKPEQGDTITLTYTETMDPNSILSGWTGGQTNVYVQITNGSGANSDTLAIYNASTLVQLPMGTVTLGRSDYVSANVSFSSAGGGTASTMTQSGASITVTLGTPSTTTGTAAGTGTMSWTPSTSATDRAGNACSATAVNESGAADKDF